MERGEWKPHAEICPACPRCGSSNTKFCYYNNYSLTQPRYFCKGCRRYWTKGGSLRSIPVGGGCRKTRRGKAIRIQRLNVSSRNSDNSRGNCNSMAESSSHAASSNNIDLAVVYANFLNQQPQPEPSTLNGPIEILPTLPSASNPPVFESSNVGMEYLDSTENCAALSGWSLDAHDQSKDLYYICGLEKKQQNINIADDQSKYELPPLPGDEVISTEDNMVNNPNQILNGMEFLGFESEADIDRRPRSELLGNGNTSMFMLPTYETTAHNFSRP